MEYVNVSDTGICSSRIGLGTAAMDGWTRDGTEARAFSATIHAALDRGVTLIDTAGSYGLGYSEELIGKALASGGRERAVIASKAGLRWDDRGDVVRDSRSERIEHEIENSLRYLQTEYIDIYQIHWPDPLVPIEETAAAIQRLYDAGKIRAIGVSNFSIEQIERFRSVAPVHTVQSPLNLFERQAEEAILPYCVQHGITTITYSALCRSLLSGTVTRGMTFPDVDNRSRDPKYQEPRFSQYIIAVERLDRLAQERYGKRVVHLAVRWLLQQPNVGAVLWGARKPERLADLNGVFDFRIDAGTLAEIDRIIGESIQDPIGPEFMGPPRRNVISRR